MSRRLSSNLFAFAIGYRVLGPFFAFAGMAGAGATLLICWQLDEHGVNPCFAIAAVSALTGLAFFRARARRKALIYKLAKSAVASAMTFGAPLVRVYRQSPMDAYGNYDFRRYDNELWYFVDHVAIRDGAADFARVPAKYKALARATMLEAVRITVRETLAPIAMREEQARREIPQGDPIAFEHWTAETLRDQGWNARVVGQTGDQGVDIIAERDSLRLAVQCKLYSGPVGNEAVQQIAAGKLYAGANLAAVVAVNGFTRAARELAAATDVQLIDAADLASFENARMH